MLNMLFKALPMLEMLFMAFADVGHAVCGLCRCWTCCLWPLPMLDMLFVAFADVGHAFYGLCLFCS
jgi:hypothetical protein